MNPHEERLALLEERAATLSMSRGPHVDELILLSQDVRKLRTELSNQDVDDAMQRLDSIACELIGTLQKWVENAPIPRFVRRAA